MTTVKNGVIDIRPEDDRECELCGTIAECRPYGPNNEQICYPCGMKDEKTTGRKAMERFLTAMIYPRNN